MGLKYSKPRERVRLQGEGASEDPGCQNIVVAVKKKKKKKELAGDLLRCFCSFYTEPRKQTTKGKLSKSPEHEKNCYSFFLLLFTKQLGWIGGIYGAFCVDIIHVQILFYRNPPFHLSYFIVLCGK